MSGSEATASFQREAAEWKARAEAARDRVHELCLDLAVSERKVARCEALRAEWDAENADYTTYDAADDLAAALADEVDELDANSSAQTIGHADSQETT